MIQIVAVAPYPLVVHPSIGRVPVVAGQRCARGYECHLLYRPYRYRDVRAGRWPAAVLRDDLRHAGK